MRILVYKRTHEGDPDENGCFGANDCMGTVRDRDFDAVIGVGGIGPEAIQNDIDGEINWIGIGPHKFDVGKRGPVVMFDHFISFGTTGDDFREQAPNLAERIYRDNVRSILGGMTEPELSEAKGILKLAEDAPPSPGLNVPPTGTKSVSKCGTVC